MANAVSTTSTINALLSQDSVKRRFEEILGNKAAGFISSVINVTKGNAQLQRADPKTILSSAAVAASLDLPIDPNIGFAYIIPYGKEAQFQMGFRGFVQLAMRTGQYATINVTEVYEGEIEPPSAKSRAMGEINWTEDGATSDEVVGYVAYFRLLNGFEKYEYMPVDRVRTHAKRHSKTYNNASSPWKTDFDAMARKTVLKRLLNKWGILSIDMQTAMKADQSVVRDGEDGQEFEYVDGEGVEVPHDDEPDLNERLSGDAEVAATDGEAPGWEDDFAKGAAEADAAKAAQQ